MLEPPYGCIGLISVSCQIEFLNFFFKIFYFKAETGGEDAFFVSSFNGGVLAIADGVSGYRPYAKCTLHCVDLCLV